MRNLCLNCQCEYEVDTYKTIDVFKQPSLREKVFDKSLFAFICPKCQKKETIFYPTIYLDRNNKFAIICDSEEKLLVNNEELANSLIQDNFYVCGASSIDGLINNITALENKLDYRIINLMMAKLAKKVKESSHINILAINFLKIKNKLCFKLIAKIDNKGNGIYIEDLDINEYEDNIQKHLNSINQVCHFDFNINTALKLLSYQNIAHQEYDEKKVVTLAILNNKDDKIILAIIPSFQSDYHTNQKVIYSDGKNYIQVATFKKSYNYNAFCLPYYIDDLPFVVKAYDNNLINETSNNLTIPLKEFKTTNFYYKVIDNNIYTSLNNKNGYNNINISYLFNYVLTHPNYNLYLDNTYLNQAKIIDYQKRLFELNYLTILPSLNIKEIKYISNKTYKILKDIYLNNISFYEEAMYEHKSIEYLKNRINKAKKAINIIMLCR